MSLNFSAEQYEPHYIPKKNGQWEIPKKFREYPRTLEGFTQPLTDEAGRFLPDVQRPPFIEWSTYKGTWGRDYVRPGVVASTTVEPGLWIVKGAQGRWKEATKVPQEDNKVKNLKKMP